ncbi:hypothetical protein MHYP_G00149650 [Metynnis hypsauchen]
MDNIYENANSLQREDSHISDADYGSVDMDAEKLEVIINYEGTNPRTFVRNEMDDEDDYEKPQTIFSEREHSDVNDDDYITVEADVEKISVCSNCKCESLNKF